MKEFLRKNKLPIILFLLVSIVVIPFVIHILFKVYLGDEFLVAEWTAGDALGYCGALLASVATVFGVFLSINYAQSNYRQDLIDRSLPFISIINRLYKPTINTYLWDSDSNSSSYSPTEFDYPIEQWFFVIQKNRKVTAVSGLSPAQQALVSSNGFHWKEENSEKVLYSKNLLYHPMDIENVGNGAATSFSVGLYIPPYDSIDNPYCFSLARSLKIGEKIKMIIFCEDICESNIGEYELCVSYYDIFGNKYEQLFEYRIFKNDQNQLQSLFKMNGTQRMVKAALS